jgi:hypothetical protein
MAKQQRRTWFKRVKEKGKEEEEKAEWVLHNKRANYTWTTGEGERELGRK